MTRAVIYVRISQDRTGAGLGVDRQREDCEALAKRNEWDVVETYIDNDVSAYSGKTRKDYRRMLADLDAGKATVVVAWHTDRLHRSMTELEEYISLSERRGVTTHTCHAGIVDLSTPSGRMTARILGAVAKQESEHKGDRVRRARQQSASNGQWGGGIRPFGWGVPTGETYTKFNKVSGEEIEVPVLDMDQVVPEEAEALRAATEQILAGETLRSVTMNLIAKGFTTTRGNALKPTEVRDMLLRARNAGIAIYRRQEIAKGTWEPIISETDWRAVVAILQDPARRTSPGNQPRWLGSGLYRCGKEGCACPGTMVVSTSGGKRRNVPSYRCRLGQITRSAEVLDTFVTDTIIERLSKPDAVELLLPAANDVDVAGLQAEATLLRQRLTDLSAMFVAGTVDAAQLTEGSRLANIQLTSVVDQLGAASVRDPLVGLAGVADARSVWEDMVLEQQRAVLRALVTVTAMPGRRGRMPDGSYTDLDSITFTWLRGKGSHLAAVAEL